MRPLGMSVVGLLLIASLALPLAAAQGPLPTACGLDLATADGNPGTGGFDVEETRTFRFTISNPNSLEARAELRLIQPPTGWVWDTVPWEGSVPANENVEVEVQVTYDGSTALDADLRAELRNVQCSGPLVGGGIQGTSPPAVTMSFTHAPLPDGGAAGGDSLWPWFIFGALVLGTAIAVPVYYQRNRVAVEAFCEDPEREVMAGRGTSFPVVVRNKASDPVHVGLEITDVHEGWSALTTLPDLELGPKESRTIYMMVRAPDGARPGDVCVAKLQVKPEGGSAETVSTVSRVAREAGDQAAQQRRQQEAEAEADEDEE